MNVEEDYEKTRHQRTPPFKELLIATFGVLFFLNVCAWCLTGRIWYG